MSYDNARINQAQINQAQIDQAQIDQAQVDQGQSDQIRTEDSNETSEQARPSRLKRRLLWICVVLGVLLLLVLTPPLVNVNRLQRRIAASMSASLGRTVHLDRVTLHLLPVPGFTLENLVVSEDPAFGAEPVIRANTVEVTLRPSSLWRRHVEFSSIKFEDPSLNLVRNADGQWNVQNLLMHAASVPSAPTAQKKHGPEPRFPYIEATGARVNLKLDEEKEPFSLTDADFALWLPNPSEWRVRLEGSPARTDRNISDPGTVRIEGSLKRAATMAGVPVDLSASWVGAPMGQATMLLTGEDAGWRGNLTVVATLQGKLGAAKLTTRMHLEELRRADFIPVQTMDLHAACGGTLDATTAVVHKVDCSMKTPTAEGTDASGRLAATADSVDLSQLSGSPELAANGLSVAAEDVSNAWLLDWIRLFSQRIPPGERPGGDVSGRLHLIPLQTGQAASWDGEIHGEIVGALPSKTSENRVVSHPVSLTSAPNSIGTANAAGKPPASGHAAAAGKPRASGHAGAVATASTGSALPNGEPSGAAGFVLAPITLTPPGRTPPLTLSGTVNAAGYTLHLLGSATGAQIAALRTMLPPLGDGLQKALPSDASSAGVVTARASGLDGSSAKAVKIDITCSRRWASPQTCAATPPPTPKRKRGRR